jgi:outer membrane protein with beta-barrel domain
MKRMHRGLVAAVFAGAVTIASPARAETLFVPWLGLNTGGTASAARDVGAGVGTTLGGVVGGDLDVGYSPGFLGRDSNGHVLTIMGNVTVGIPFDGTRRAGLRPYVTGGIGVIHSRIDDRLYGLSSSSTDFGMNAGGGVLAFFNRHLGVRADLRYIRSAENEAPAGRVHFWRTSFGVTLR